MSNYRSYFEKNNTLIKNSKVNTAKSPTTSIFYGSGFSRYIFKVDFSDLKTKIDNGDLVIKEDTKHYLRMTNTVFGDPNTLGKEKMNGKQRATSFDLVLFDVPEFWDEGVGYDDDISASDFGVGNITYNEQPSNWYNRTILNPWENEGILVNEENIVTKIHFDNGNEDINVDITDYVNSILNGEKTYHGMGICFDNVYEQLNININKSVSFFTKYTQTFFEPFLESVFSDTIIDNRNNFTEGLNQRLHLTINNGEKYVDLDENPIVDVYNHNNELVMFDVPTEKLRKGVYCVKLNIVNDTITGRNFYYDTWKNLKIHGTPLDDQRLRFLPKKIENGLSFNGDIDKTPKLTVRTVGLQQNEKIRGGDVRKVTVHFKSIGDIKNIYSEVHYRIFIWEGRTQVSVQDWTLMDNLNENSFHLDTGMLIPREYSMEIRVKNGDEVITMNEKINFEIISQR